MPGRRSNLKPDVRLSGEAQKIHGSKMSSERDDKELDLLNPARCGEASSDSCVRSFEGQSAEWFGSDGEDDDEDEEEGKSDEEEEENTKERVLHTQGDVEMDEDKESSSKNNDELVVGAPLPEPGENYTAYWSRTASFWRNLASNTMISLAERYARNFFESSKRRAD